MFLLLLIDTYQLYTVLPKVEQADYNGRVLMVTTRPSSFREREAENQPRSRPGLVLLKTPWRPRAAHGPSRPLGGLTSSMCLYREVPFILNITPSALLVLVEQ